MEREPTHVLKVDEINLGDAEAFEKMAGSKIVDAISPRVLLDEDGRPIPDPDDERKRPLMARQMTMPELLAALAIAARQADRANQDKYTMDYARGLSLTKTVFALDWGADLGDDTDPTEPADENIDAGLTATE